MLETFTIPLDDPQATLEAVGGKGASLARLARAGLPVPGGFHITTSAYRLFIAVNDLQKGVMAALKKPTRRNHPRLKLLLKSSVQHLPGQNPRRVGRCHPARLRLLARIEPGCGSSLLGYSRGPARGPPLPVSRRLTLNISGKEALLNAIQKCWASLWTGHRSRTAFARKLHPTMLPWL